MMGDQIGFGEERGKMFLGSGKFYVLNDLDMYF